MKKRMLMQERNNQNEVNLLQSFLKKKERSLEQRIENVFKQEQKWYSAQERQDRYFNELKLAERRITKTIDEFLRRGGEIKAEGFIIHNMGKLIEEEKGRVVNIR